MKYRMLELIWEEKGYTRKTIAEKLNMSYGALSRRINGKRDFSLSEIRNIVDILELDDNQINTCFYFIKKVS